MRLHHATAQVDCFNPLKIDRKGYLIFNMRGGSLYIPQQFTDKTVEQLFNPGELGLIKGLKLHPHGKQGIPLGDVYARFLYFTDTATLPGMVLRFANLTDRQLEILNKLTQELTKIGASEKDFVARALKKKNST